jgi:hypothetical protein
MWRPPPPSCGEGELRLKKLDAAIQAITAMAKRVCDPGDPISDALGLDRQDRDAVAADFGGDAEPLFEAPDDAALFGDDLVGAVIAEFSAPPPKIDIDFAFVESELRLVALAQHGHPWLIRPGFPTPRNGDDLLRSLKRDKELATALRSAMSLAAETIWIEVPPFQSRAQRITAAQRMGRTIMRLLPSPLWSAIEQWLDELYNDWRETALRKLGARRMAWEDRVDIVPPAVRIIPLHSLLEGRYGRWRPHALLRGKLFEAVDRRRNAAKRAQEAKGLVRLAQPARVPTAKSGFVSPNDPKRRREEETAQLRTALSTPRGFAHAGDVDARIALLYARFPWCGGVLEHGDVRQKRILSF